MVKTKCVYDASSEDDGKRVLVTRYWPRGVKKERADEWIRGLGPAPELIKDWKSEKISWEEFKARYRAEFKEPEKKRLLAELKETVEMADTDITLLCTCRDEARCHRNLLSAMLRAGSSRGSRR